MDSILKSYPDYKASGVPWLEEVPVHWQIERAKWLFRKMARPLQESDEIVTCFRDGVVTLRKNRRELGFTESIKEIGYQGIRRGDLVIHAMDAFAGAIGVADSDGKGTPVYSICKSAPRANAYYYAYTLREMARNQWIQALAKGIRERSSDFRYTDFGSQSVPLPSLSEQTAIVRYLDHADRSIHRYISAKERLIDLLEEQRQAVIQRAVTRGINPNVRLKPSGVQWLGDVPAHWEVMRLRYLIKRKLTYGANAAAEYADPDWPRYLRITDFDQDGVLKSNTFRSLPPEIARNYLVQPGDILLARSGATVGKAFLVPEDAGEACYAGYLIRACPQNAQIDPHFLFAFTQSTGFTRWKNSTFILSTIQNISAEKYANLHIPCPPLSEQTQIIHCLNKETTSINAAIDRSRREIELLNEYRTRLIADVVTGKLDVHEAAF